jgi:hypothetical protein
MILLRAGTMTHDYKRHGVTTLFAALNVVEGQGLRPMYEASSPSGVHPLPQCHRCQGAEEDDGPWRRRKSAHGHPKVHGLANTRASSSISPRHPPRGSMPSRASSPTSQRSGSNVACSNPSRNSKTPSTASLTKPTQTPSPLPGPRIKTKSSPPSNEGTNC